MRVSELLSVAHIPAANICAAVSFRAHSPSIPQGSFCGPWRWSWLRSPCVCRARIAPLPWCGSSSPAYHCGLIQPDIQDLTREDSGNSIYKSLRTLTLKALQNHYNRLLSGRSLVRSQQDPFQLYQGFRGFSLIRLGILVSSETTRKDQ